MPDVTIEWIREQIVRMKDDIEWQKDYVVEEQKALAVLRKNLVMLQAIEDRLGKCGDTKSSPCCSCDVADNPVCCDG